MSMFELLQQEGGLTDHDLAHLADWANEQKNSVLNQDWKRAYALLREGADLLIRRRAMSRLPIVGLKGQDCHPNAPNGEGLKNEIAAAAKETISK